MAIAITHSRAQFGIDAPAVAIETHLTNGLPAFNLVGLPETSVRESKERVRSCPPNHDQSGAGRSAEGRHALRPRYRPQRIGRLGASTDQRIGPV